MKFALITEGASEHRVIKHIVYKYFKDADPEINQIQPEIIKDRQASTGGWPEVLKYCSREKLNDILIENDYLIIQIDTDQSQTDPFSISHSKAGGIAKTPEELHDDVVQKLSGLIRPEIRAIHSRKIFFAICIHTIECWLLPLYYNNHHRSDKPNCLSYLNEALDRKKIREINKGSKNNPESVQSYEAILKNIKRRQDIEFIAQYNTGFNRFIHSIAEGVV